MCLRTVTSTTRDRKREGTGWKVFAISNGKPYSTHFGDSKPREEGIWLKSRDDKSEDYPLGFHIFKTREEARRWKCWGQVIRKVKFRDVLAEGIQSRWGPLRTIVAKEMMIPA